MAESKLDGPVENCRPAVGLGAPAPAGAHQEQPGGAVPKLVSFIDPAKHIGGVLVRQMARETCLVLLREQARSLMRVMGLGYDDMALVLRTACVEFTQLHGQSVPLPE